MCITIGWMGRRAAERLFSSSSGHGTTISSDSMHNGTVKSTFWYFICDKVTPLGDRPASHRHKCVYR